MNGHSQDRRACLKGARTRHRDVSFFTFPIDRFVLVFSLRARSSGSLAGSRWRLTRSSDAISSVLSATRLACAARAQQSGLAHFGYICNRLKEGHMPLEPFGFGRHIRSLACHRRPCVGKRQRHHRLGRESHRCRYASRACRRVTAGLHGSANDGDGPCRDVRRGQFDRAALPTVSGAAARGPRHVEGSRRSGGCRCGTGDN